MGHESFDRVHQVQGSSNRSLGLVFGAVFLIIGVYLWFSGAPIRLWSLAICAGFVALGLAFSRVLTLLNKVWTRFGLVLHKIVSPIVLGIMFFAVMILLGLLMRRLGKDPLK